MQADGLELSELRQACLQRSNSWHTQLTLDLLEASSWSPILCKQEQHGASESALRLELGSFPRRLGQLAARPAVFDELTALVTATLSEVHNAPIHLRDLRVVWAFSEAREGGLPFRGEQFVLVRRNASVLQHAFAQYLEGFGQAAWAALWREVQVFSLAEEVGQTLLVELERPLEPTLEAHRRHLEAGLAGLWFGLGSDRGQTAQARLRVRSRGTWSF